MAVQSSDLARIVHAYYGALNERQFDAAAELFALDGSFRHPAYEDESVATAHACVGVDAIRQFLTLHSRAATKRNVTRVFRNGPECAVVGKLTASDGRGIASFMAWFCFDELTGLITRYEAYVNRC